MKPGFRLGVYVFKDAEIVDYAAAYDAYRDDIEYDTPQ